MQQPTEFRVSNQSWAYATAHQLWEGQELETLTPREYYEMKDWEAEIRNEERVARMYGDGGHSIVMTEDYFQMCAEDAHAAYGLPMPPMGSAFYYGF